MRYDPLARGTFPVGVRTAVLRDRARGDRELTVEIWYPASAAAGLDLDPNSQDRYTIAPGLPAMRQSALRDAAIAPGCFPLLVHAHGANGDRRDKTFLCTHLASHGYIVASPDFPGDTMSQMVSDRDSGAGKRLAMSIEELADYRPADAAFVLESVLTGSVAMLAGRVDRDRVGVLGHSFGGWTSLAINSIDRRPLAVFAMAPLWGSRSPIAEVRRVGPRLRLDDWGRPVATYCLAAEFDNCVMLEDLRELGEQLPAPSTFAILRGAGHMHFSDDAAVVHEFMRAMWASPDFPDAENDGPALARAARPFAELLPEAPAHDAIRALCLAHFDAEVKRDLAARAWLDTEAQEILAARGATIEVPSTSAGAVAS